VLNPYHNLFSSRNCPRSCGASLFVLKIRLSSFQVREVRVSRFQVIIACCTFVLCLKYLGVVVMACNVAKCRWDSWMLADARGNSGEHWFSYPSERVSPRRD